MLDIILLKNRRKDKVKPFNKQQAVSHIYTYLTVNLVLS